MLEARIFPTLLIQGKGLVKTTRFQKPRYVGDPLNAVRIFNTKEVDELLVLDIDATRQGRGPDVELVTRISDECFMPLTIGGGIRSVEQARQLLQAGAEKVAINTAGWDNLSLITSAAHEFGSQCIVASIDARRKWGGYRVCTHAGKRVQKTDPVKHARNLEQAGAGEILINSVDRDGMMNGYDVDLVRSIADAVQVPVIASGGAGAVEHFGEVIRDGHASAATAGSFFLFHGRRRAVLISFPPRNELQAALA